MYHDTAKTGCDHRTGPILHIMTPSFEVDTVLVREKRLYLIFILIYATTIIGELVKLQSKRYHTLFGVSLCI